MISGNRHRHINQNHLRLALCLSGPCFSPKIWEIREAISTCIRCHLMAPFSISLHVPRGKSEITMHPLRSTPFHSVPLRSPKVIAERCGVLGDFVVVFCRHKARQAHLLPAGREGMAGPPLPTPKEFQGASYIKLRQKI